MNDSPAPRRAVFLDRDDTLIRNIPYLGDPAGVELLGGVRTGLERLRAAGFDLIIVSNQSGVGRGLITKAQVAAVNAEMDLQLGGGVFLDIFNCYATPEDPWGVDDRKPAPGLLLDAAEKHGIDLSRSWLIGDRWSDIEAGRRAGCRPVLVRTGAQDGQEDLARAGALAEFAADDFAGAVEWILTQEARG